MTSHKDATAPQHAWNRTWRNNPWIMLQNEEADPCLHDKAIDAMQGQKETPWRSRGAGSTLESGLDRRKWGMHGAGSSDKITEFTAPRPRDAPPPQIWNAEPSLVNKSSSPPSRKVTWSVIIPLYRMEIRINVMEPNRDPYVKCIGAKHTHCKIALEVSNTDSEKPTRLSVRHTLSEDLPVILKMHPDCTA
ncbi:hypothetical protein NM688_g4658 [Phlebia brevispora]|uniref:Uncharacterized protein n=1 Tax=Phlebia brevispora TaxID=194682 RepID=A0ACC1T295_9APHY|nr:hypothetical protein NM688_g4658 [Phlebia brevispora]